MQEDALDYTHSRLPTTNDVYAAMESGIREVTPLLEGGGVTVILDDENRTSIILRSDFTWEIE